MCAVRAPLVGTRAKRKSMSTTGSRFLLIALLAPLLALAGRAHAEGDAAHGRQIFETCGICHSNRAGEVKLGPSLFGVVGRKAGSVPGFHYTPGLQKLTEMTWTPEQIFKWLEDPSKMAAGPAISVNLAGGKDPEDVGSSRQTLR